MIKAIDRTYNRLQEKHEMTYLANSAAEITADFGVDDAIGSQIICVAEGKIYFKNTNGKWQLFGGTTEI